MRLLGLSGSLRAASTNTALLQGLAGALPAGVVMEVIAPGHLPLFSPDLEGPPAPPEVDAFAADVARADGIVVSCPEYARAVPGAFKNAIDWLVGREECIGKPIVLAHASHRGEDVLAQLRLVLGTVSENFWPDIHARFSLISMTRDEVAAHLASPDNTRVMQAFLAEFLGRITERVTGARTV